jgi:hypothetical protein
MVPDARVFSSMQNEQKYGFTHGYMTVWYIKGIYVSFVNCFVAILSHHNNLLLLALTVVAILLLYLQTNKCIALPIFSQFTFTR